MSTINYYSVLEVPPNSTAEDIRQAYRRLAQKYLADPVAFAALGEAFEILNDPMRRSDYDHAFSAGQNAMEMTSETTQMMPSSATATHHCPMGVGAQCPVLNGRVAATDIYCSECGFLLGSEPAEGFALEAAPSESHPYLEEQTGQIHRLRVGVNSVGREGTDVLLPDKTVSRHHAQIVLTEEGVVTIEDNGSTNGTQINGERLLPDTTRLVNVGDTVRFGSVRLLLRLPGMESGEIGTAEPERTTLMSDRFAQIVAQLIGVGETTGDIGLFAGTTLFGRAPTNTVVISQDPYVSSRHAKIVIDGQTAQVTDVGSTNGTKLNGTRLTSHETSPLAPGDEIAFGGTTFRFQWQPQAAEPERETSEPDISEPEAPAQRDEE